MGDFLRNLMCKSAFFARNEGIMADFSFFCLNDNYCFEIIKLV